MIRTIVDPIINPFVPFDNIVPSWLRPYLLSFHNSGNLAPYNPPVDNTWYDSSGNGRHMTMGNLAYTPLSTLSSANGFECDGVDDYGVIADSAATRLITGGTLCAWIYPIGLGGGGYGRIIDKSTNSSSANGYSFNVYETNQLYSNVNGGVTPLASINNAIALSRWQLAGVTFDANGRQLYVNGIDVTSTGGTQTALPPNVAGVVTIGNLSGATTRTFNGYIDRPMIFSRALTASEIRQLYLGSRRRYGV